MTETIYRDNAARAAIRRLRLQYGLSTAQLATAMTFAGYPMTNGTARTLESPGDHTVSNYGPLNRQMIDAFARVFGVDREEICPDEIYYDTARVKVNPHRASKRTLSERDTYPVSLPPLPVDYALQRVRCEHERELNVRLTWHTRELLALAELHRKSPISDRCAECQNPHPCTSYARITALVEDIRNVPTADR